MRKVQKPQASVLNAAWVFSIRTLADCVSQKPDAAGRLPRTFRESCLLITAQAHTCPTHLEHCCPITHPSHNQKYSRGHRNRHTQEACSEHKYAPFQEQGTKYNLKYGCSFQLFFLTFAILALKSQSESDDLLCAIRLESNWILLRRFGVNWSFKKLHWYRVLCLLSLYNLYVVWITVEITYKVFY